MTKIHEDDNDWRARGYFREDSMYRTCNLELFGNFSLEEKPHSCYFLHHFDPYLKLGPFKLEEYVHRPYRVVFRDILSETEIDHMINLSKPKLSRHRGKNQGNIQAVPSDFKYGKKKATIHKTVQHWFNDVSYPKDFNYHFEGEDGGQFAFFDNIWYNCPHGSDKECRKYLIEDEIMYKLSLKIERATRMQIRVKGSSTEYQVCFKPAFVTE